jgi:phospholipase C
VIVVMLENRSFDHLFGYLDPPVPGFDGLAAGHDTNPLDPAHPERGTVRAERRARLALRVDPNHSHASVMAQLGIAGTPDAPRATTASSPTTNWTAPAAPRMRCGRESSAGS